MKKIKAIIERAPGGMYSVYLGEGLDYGLLGEGLTASEAQADFLNSYEEMKAIFEKKKLEFTEAEFEFSYDVASFLSYYSKILSLAGLERLTGINQGQLSHYATGRKKPGPKTVKKIEQSLRNFAEDLKQVELL